MIYRVIGELVPQNRQLDGRDLDRHISEFDNYTDASDYYSLTFQQMAHDITDIGGEFIITLMAITDDNTGQVLKRHLASTTILL